VQEEAIYSTKQAVVRMLAAVLYFLGALLYMLGSIGYIITDAFAASGTDSGDSAAVFTALAVVFFVDAIVYLAAFLTDDSARPKPWTCSVGFWANALYVFAAALYVVSSGLCYLPIPQGDASALQKTSLFTIKIAVQAAVQFSALLLYSLDSLLYNSQYHGQRDELAMCWKDKYWHAGTASCSTRSLFGNIDVSTIWTNDAGRQLLHVA
jgi:hypothetical protein